MAVIKKIVLLGDSAVGKTSLIRRYVFDQFSDSYIATIGSKTTMKELKIRKEDKTIDLILTIWDLIGREGYSSLHARTLIGVHGAIFVADLTRQETLHSLECYWIPFLFKVVENVPIIFVCNKSDLKNQYQFNLADLVDIAKRYNSDANRILPFGLETSYSTSAKDGSNVESAFESLGHLLLSDTNLIDPVKELYESLVAARIRRSTDKTTAIGALDAIIMDFCDGFEDSRMAMIILRQEVARAGIDINNPTRKGVLKLVEFLAEVELELKDEKIVNKNQEKRKKWAESIKK